MGGEFEENLSFGDMMDEGQGGEPISLETLVMDADCGGELPFGETLKAAEGDFLLMCEEYAEQLPSVETHAMDSDLGIEFPHGAVLEASEVHREDPTYGDILANDPEEAPVDMLISAGISIDSDCGNKFQASDIEKEDPTYGDMLAMGPDVAPIYAEYGAEKEEKLIYGDKILFSAEHDEGTISGYLLEPGSVEKLAADADCGREFPSGNGEETTSEETLAIGAEKEENSSCGDKIVASTELVMDSKCEEEHGEDEEISESEESSESEETSDSDSDEDEDAEVEEGEVEEDKMVSWSDSEEDEPVRSKNELMAPLPVSKVVATLQPHHQLLPVGIVSSVVGKQVIVEGVEIHNPLNEGSILWITEHRTPLGLVDEIFGPVKNPFYLVRFNSESEVPASIQTGSKVSFVNEFACHVLNDGNLYKKGYDASGENDEEVSDNEFSDDEKEIEFKKNLKMSKIWKSSKPDRNRNKTSKTGSFPKPIDPPQNFRPHLPSPSQPIFRPPNLQPQNSPFPGGFPPHDLAWPLLNQLQQNYQIPLVNSPAFPQQFCPNQFPVGMLQGGQPSDFSSIVRAVMGSVLQGQASVPNVASLDGINHALMQQSFMTPPIPPQLPFNMGMYSPPENNNRRWNGHSHGKGRPPGGRF